MYIFIYIYIFGVWVVFFYDKHHRWYLNGDGVCGFVHPFFPPTGSNPYDLGSVMCILDVQPTPGDRKQGRKNTQQARW